MKRLLSLALALALGMTFAGAQPKATMQIICNVPGAQVFLAGQLIGTTTPNLVLNIRQGNYPLKIIKNGYNDFDTMVAVGPGGAMIQANLVPKGAAPAPNTIKAPNTIATPQVLNYGLSVASNINGASVFINGNPAGQTPFSSQLPNGSYTVVVRANGYMDFSQNIVINGGPFQINAMLQGQNQQLSVQCNVTGADVYINGNMAGKAPFISQVPQGSYSIVVKAAGYGDFSQNMVVGNGPATVNAMLQPMLASWQLRLPEHMLNKDIKTGQSRGIQVWVDNMLQAETLGPIVAAGQLFPGRHSIRVVSGGLAVETQVDVQAGRAYIIEPFMGINIK